jgi:hypothetical protein
LSLSSGAGTTYITAALGDQLGFIDASGSRIENALVKPRGREGQADRRVDVA